MDADADYPADPGRQDAGAGEQGDFGRKHPVFSLEGFEEGTIKVRFYNNGVSGVKAQVRVA